MNKSDALTEQCSIKPLLTGSKVKDVNSMTFRELAELPVSPRLISIDLAEDKLLENANKKKFELKYGRIQALLEILKDPETELLLFLECWDELVLYYKGVITETIEATLKVPKRAIMIYSECSVSILNKIFSVDKDSLKNLNIALNIGNKEIVVKLYYIPNEANKFPTAAF